MRGADVKLFTDMAVASILMSMSMGMMMPPLIISLPFKLIFFVPVDGWRLIDPPGFPSPHVANATLGRE